MSHRTEDPQRTEEAQETVMAYDCLGGAKRFADVGPARVKERGT